MSIPICLECGSPFMHEVYCVLSKLFVWKCDDCCHINDEESEDNHVD